jgi:hypothetical protein
VIAPESGVIIAIRGTTKYTDVVARVHSTSIASGHLSAGTQDRSGDRPDGERITIIEPGHLSKEPEKITKSSNPKDAKDFNCVGGSFLAMGPDGF